ncbi:hypothetical protein AB4Y44_27510 [Paraburkholderia sp. BR10937]
MTKLFNRITSGKFRSLVGESVRIDQSISDLWRQRGMIIRYLVIWQSLQCIRNRAGALARALFSRSERKLSAGNRNSELRRKRFRS